MNNEQIPIGAFQKVTHRHIQYTYINKTLYLFIIRSKSTLDQITNTPEFDGFFLYFELLQDSNSIRNF